MKKSSALFSTLLLVSAVAHARTAYVTDSIDLPLRANESERSKIIKMLNNGAELEVLSEGTEDGYAYVRTIGGVEGFILTRYLTNEPISKVLLEKTSRKKEELVADNKKLKDELARLKSETDAAVARNQTLSKEHDKLNADYTELQQTAANAVQIKHQRDQLQEQIIASERELQQLKLENQALTDSTNQDWFLYGGGVAFAGLLLGFFLPKINWRRRSGGWDSF